jgi:hypothetical protein
MDDSPLLRAMGDGDVLLIDRRQQVEMNASLGQRLRLGWSSEKDHGQYLYSEDDQ